MSNCHLGFILLVELVLNLVSRRTVTGPNSRVGSKSKMKKSIFERSPSDLSLGNTLFNSHYIFIPDQYNNSIVHLL